MHSFQIRNFHNNHPLKLEEIKIQKLVANQHKFLRLIFDKNVPFIPYIKKTEKSACNKTQQLLRVLGHIEE